MEPRRRKTSLGGHISFLAFCLVSLGYGKADAEIPCRVVQVVAETDPVNRNLKPAFHYVYECRGGLSLRKGLQCQAVKTDRKRLKVLNVYRGKEEVRYVETAVTCQEKCVCRGRCKNPKTGHCNNGLRWNPGSCRCECTKTPAALTGEQPKGFSLKYFIVAVVLLFAIFALATVVTVTICHVRYRRKMEKYRFLRIVEWDSEQAERLERHMSYVDGPASAELKRKRSRKICCFPILGKRKKADILLPELNGGDEVDAGSIKYLAGNFPAKECFEIGYLAFKRQKYDKMLLWMKEAERKWAENEAGESDESADFQRDLYSYLSIAYLADKSWDIQKAHEYKAKALQIQSHARSEVGR